MEKYAVRIEAEVNNILLRHANGTFPISPLQIAKSMGIKVVDKRNAAELMSIIDPDNSLDALPAFSIRWGGKYTIIIDTDHGDRLWRRLRLAHEIGHYVLDGDNVNAGCTSVSRLFHGAFERSLLELSCDIFAMGLLMPQILLKMGGLTTERQISRACRVSGVMAHLSAASIHFRTGNYTGADLRLYSKFHMAMRPYRDRPLASFARFDNPAFQSDISEELFYT